jgi:hypothetical protein
MGKKNATLTLSLVQNKPSKDVIETLEYLLQEAIEGNLIGLAYGALLPNRRLFVDAAGEAHTDPARGIGVAQILSFEMMSRLAKNGVD